jgi:hypothetical protein
VRSNPDRKELANLSYQSCDFTKLGNIRTGSLI